MVDIEIPVGMADADVALLLALLNDGTKEWRKHLGDVSPEALVWQSAPRGHSIGTVLLHMADVEGNWLYTAAHGEARSADELKMLLSAETDQYAGDWPPPPAEPLAWFYARQDDVRRRTLESFASVADIRATRPFRDTRFTLRWLLSHVIAHESYHGGQAVLLHELFKTRGDREHARVG